MGRRAGIDGSGKISSPKGFVSRTVCAFASRCNTGKKGKAIPLQAGTGPEGSRRLRFPDFKTIGT